MSIHEYQKSTSFFATLVAVTAAGPVAVQLFIPSVPAIAKDFDVSLGATQIAFSMPLVLMALSMLFFGPLSDRFGRRIVLLCGMAIFLVGSIIAGLANELVILIVGRALQSVGGAGGLVIARAIVRDIYGPEQAARVLGTLITVFIAAPMVAVILGGILTDLFGWRSIFYLTIGLGLTVTLMVYYVLPSVPPKQNQLKGVGSVVRAYATLLRSPVFIGFAFQGAFAPGAFMAFMAVGPYLTVTILDRTATEFGIYFGLVTLLFMGANYVGGRLSHPIGLERMVIIGAIVATVFSIAGLSLYLTTGLTFFVMFATQTMSSIGNGLAMPNSQAGALNVNPELAGTASGGAAFVQTMIGAMFAQTVASATGDTGLPLFIATLFAACGALVFGVIPFLVQRHSLT